ncbi:MAG: TVP38/TMEM64 family protein [Desulfobacterales bacterium]|nr:TVP38/TMEM64 family protein [Desulfobacterales bacterium]
MKSLSTKTVLAAVLLLTAAVALACLFRYPLAEALTGLWSCVADRDRLTAFVSGFGAGAPLVFILVQVAQVLLAPVPGEATGFIGGYLFGMVPGFLYSTVGLTLGSWLNLFVGRLLGHRYVRRLIPLVHMNRFDRVLRRRGLAVVFLMFAFPGFPKDYLCLFLGLSDIPMRILLVLAAVGRLPGTLMLSLQGALLFEKNYFLLAAAVAVFGGAAVFFYLIRNRFYRWVEKVNGGGPPSR